MKSIKCIIYSLIAMCLLLVVHNSIAAQDKNLIVGAGAHFSWIVFDELKEELENISGKKLQLYGQGSLMGVGCNAGIKTALKSTPENETFGFACCPISDEEIAEKKIQVYPIALEPVLTIVHKDNPVQNLSAEQVRAIFRGDILNWKEVGGQDKPILVVARLHCKDRPGHWKTILPNAESFVQKRLNVKSAAAMVENINKFTNAIGHIGSAWRYKKGDQVKALKIDNYPATTETLKNKKYPFYRQLSAVTTLSPSPDLLKIIKHAQTSDTLRRIAKEFNLLPVADE